MLVRGRQTPSRRFTRSGRIVAVEGRPRRRSVRARGQGRGGPGGRARCSRSGWRAHPACLPPAAPSGPRVRSGALRRAPAGSSTRSGADSLACRSLSAARNRTGPALAPGPRATGSKGDSRTPRSRRGRRRSSSGRRSRSSTRIQPERARPAVRSAHGTILPVSRKRSSEAWIRSRHFTKRQVAARVPVEAQPWPASARRQQGVEGRRGAHAPGPDLGGDDPLDEVEAALKAAPLANHQSPGEPQRFGHPAAELEVPPAGAAPARY